MDSLQDFFDKMKLEMQNQTKEILSKMDEKLVPFTCEIEELKSENKKLREKLCSLEKNKRQNNIIIFGLKENEQSLSDLMELIKAKISSDLNIPLENRDINTIYRIGNKNTSNKDRPILVTFVNGWKKTEIMRNRNKLKDVYATEDYPKEVLDKRKELQEKLVEERKKGNFAVIKYDKLIVKEGLADRETRKRGLSLLSPEATSQQPRKQYVAPKSSKTHRINAFDMMRGRSNSLSSFNLTTENSK